MPKPKAPKAKVKKEPALKEPREMTVERELEQEAEKAAGRL